MGSRDGTERRVEKNPKNQQKETQMDGSVVSEATDIFAEAERVRADRASTGAGPKITRKPMPLGVVTKTKAWFRTHLEGIYPGIPVFIDPTSEDMEPKPHYLHSEMMDELEGTDGIVMMTGYLICTANLRNQLLLVREADFDGNMHSATEAKHEAAVEAKGTWVRMSWDRDSGAYDVLHGDFERKQPRWPEDISRVTIMRLAFGKAFIDDPDHPLLRNLRGVG